MKVQLIDSVKNIVDYIISNDNYVTSPEIDVLQGSEVGDGYASKTYAISIKSDNAKTVQLFVKYLPETINSEWKDMFIAAFQTEFRFYQEIYPAFKRFQEQKSLKNPFDNVPKHYRTNISNCDTPPIVLENLKSVGYTLRDRKVPVDGHHLKLPIEAFARYHAISYAMKDQDPNLFQKLSNGMVDIFTKNLEKSGMVDILTNCINQFLDSLDPVNDQKCLEHCKNLCEVLVQHSLKIPQYADEYSVIGQGDCWSNNMMFLYDNKTGLPIDVKLIDWQCQRVNSPLLDFAYFFYSLATKEALDKADYFLNLYYNTLTQRIKELGSDPEKMYPYEVFLTHWRKFALFGLCMAFCIAKVLLFEEDEVPDLINSKELPINSFSAVLKHQDKYINRMRVLVEHFIEKGLL